MNEEQWTNAGFIRNEDGVVWLIWECTECGFQGLGGMSPPKCKCPECEMGYFENVGE